PPSRGQPTAHLAAQAAAQAEKIISDLKVEYSDVFTIDAAGPNSLRWFLDRITPTIEKLKQALC
ncbi:hypothetical protein, partial [Corynebacterium variabile]|uniref:hypothetical protein n=1 Tax=Corynebacterium variabile TaxID=1727 RepID=UPI002649B8AC